MNKERWTKQKILKTCLELIPKLNAETLTAFLIRVEREERYFSKMTFYKKIRPDSAEYKQIVEAIEDNNIYLGEYGLGKLKKLVDDYNLKAIEDWLRIYGSDKVKQALSRNYNITAKADINLEEKRSKAREIIGKLTEEEKKQLRKILNKYYENG